MEGWPLFSEADLVELPDVEMLDLPGWHKPSDVPWYWHNESINQVAHITCAGGIVITVCPDAYTTAFVARRVVGLRERTARIVVTAEVLANVRRGDEVDYLNMIVQQLCEELTHVHGMRADREPDRRGITDTPQTLRTVADRYAPADQFYFLQNQRT